jgi:hypothetical protein
VGLSTEKLSLKHDSRVVGEADKPHLTEAQKIYMTCMQKSNGMHSTKHPPVEILEQMHNRTKPSKLDIGFQKGIANFYKRFQTVSKQR